MRSLLLSVLVLASCSRGFRRVGVASLPPSELAYATNPALYFRDVAIAPNTPSYKGETATLFTVSPPLPTGLVLDPQTGVINGTPTVTLRSTTFTVTLVNAVATTTVALGMAIEDVPPSGLSYGDLRRHHRPPALHGSQRQLHHVDGGEQGRCALPRRALSHLPRRADAQLHGDRVVLGGAARLSHRTTGSRCRRPRSRLGTDNP
ncbi:MAG: putative Ig domain-containing protein [Deltaproteobacteria bacterium]|nr:putative Ig domain-containing protein [Deltaproteobacteria bacterium]